MALYSKHSEKIYIIVWRWLTERLLCQLVISSGKINKNGSQASSLVQYESSFIAFVSVIMDNNDQECVPWQLHTFSAKMNAQPYEMLAVCQIWNSFLPIGSPTNCEGTK